MCGWTSAPPWRRVKAIRSRVEDDIGTHRRREPTSADPNHRSSPVSVAPMSDVHNTEPQLRGASSVEESMSSHRRVARWILALVLVSASISILPGIASGAPFHVGDHFNDPGPDQLASAAAHSNGQARSARDASRHRWADLSAGKALSVGRSAFPAELTSRLFDGRQPSPGLKILQYRSRNVAVAETAGGQRLLVQSSTPLRAQTPSGPMAPVDLSLTESTHTFSTANSTVDLQISKDPT